MKDNFDKIIKNNIIKVNDWIDSTVKKHRDKRAPVIGFSFQRLPMYFSDEVLESSYAVAVTGNPPLPIELFTNELKFIADYFQGAIAAITYKDTYFIRESLLYDESLHFHELIHVIQWTRLGYEKMLYYYASGLIESGYRSSLLEDMAFKHQEKFDSREGPYDVRSEVVAELDRFLKQ